MRHRALLLLLRDRFDLPGRAGRVLHVGPARAVASWLEAQTALDYVSVDLDSPIARVHADATDLPFDDESFDFAICVHVLEHIPDDRKALAEFFRVLRPGGAGDLPGAARATSRRRARTRPSPTPASASGSSASTTTSASAAPTTAIGSPTAGFEVDARGLRRRAGRAGPAPSRPAHGRALRPLREAGAPDEHRGDRRPAPAALPAAEKIRRISVVAPMWNEARHIEQLVADLAAQDFDGEVELLVADGGSTDGSVELLQGGRRAPRRRRCRSFDNPARWVSRGPQRLHPRGDRRPDRPRRLPQRLPARLPPPVRARSPRRPAPTTSAASSCPRGETRRRAGGRRARWTARSAASTGRATATTGRHEVDTVPYGAFRPRGVRARRPLRRDARAQPGRRVQPPPAARRRPHRARPVDPHLLHAAGQLQAAVPAVLRVRPLEAAGDAEARQRRQRPQPRAGRSSWHRCLASRCSRSSLSTLALILLALEVARLPRRRARLRRPRDPGDARESLRLLPRVLAVVPDLPLAYGLGMAAAGARAWRERAR